MIPIPQPGRFLARWGIVVGETIERRRSTKSSITTVLMVFTVSSLVYLILISLLINTSTILEQVQTRRERSRYFMKKILKHEKEEKKRGTSGPQQP